MKFIAPENLLHLLWVLPLLTAVYGYAAVRRKKILHQLFGDSPEEHIVLSKKRRILRIVLFYGAVILLFAALARPAWKYEIRETGGSGRDLLVLFDVSRSMYCQDVQPSRLEHAKWFVRELVRKNPGDRFGLIPFAGKAFLECPLTVDSESFLQSLAELTPDSVPVGGTNIEEALKEALRAFTGAETANRAVILITDGDELYGDSGKSVADLASRKIPLFVAGVGDPAQPAIVQVPDGKGGFTTLKDKKGNVVSSPLNEKQLAELAVRTGGIYVRSTAAETGFNAMEKRIRTLDPEEYESVTQSKPVERFQIPLWGAVILLLIWCVLGERPKNRNRSGKAAAALALLFVLPQLSAGEPEKTAPETVYQEILKEFEEHPIDLAGVATDPETLKNYAQKYEGILQETAPESELYGRSAQNLGTIRHVQARAAMADSIQKLRSQNLDEAKKSVEQSIQTFNEAEKTYAVSMSAAQECEGLAKNETLLLKERQDAEELKKKIEELQKQQQQTRQQTQQAKDQQQQQNQQQQNQQQQNQNQSQQQQTQQAKDSAEQMEKMAQSLGQTKMEDQAKQAKDELQKAMDEQKKGDGKSAEKHLEKALESLGKPEEKQDGKDGSKEEKKDSGKDAEQKDSEKSEPQQNPDGEKDKGEPRQEPQPSEEEVEGKIDKDQAEALLDVMAEDEKSLRDALKDQMKRNSRMAPVSKDW